MSKEIEPITNEFWTPKSLEIIDTYPEDDQATQRANIIRNGIQQLAVHMKLPNQKLTPVSDPDSFSIYWEFVRSTNGILLPAKTNDDILADFRKPAARITLTDIGSKKFLSVFKPGMPINPTKNNRKIAIEGCSYIPELDETVRYAEDPDVDLCVSSTGFEKMDSEQFSAASAKVINFANAANVELKPQQA